MIRQSWRRMLIVVAMLATSSLSCGREITGPSRSGPRLSAAIALAPRLPQAVRGVDGASLVLYQSVRLVFQRAGGVTALDRTYAFPSTADSLALTVAVPLGDNATDAGESFNLTLRLLAANGVVLFEGGPVPVFARAEGATGPPPQPVEVPVTCVGPGAQATRLVIGGSSSVQLSGTQAIAFSAQAFDALDQIVPNAEVIFTSLDTSIVQVGATGNAVARNKRGGTLVIGRLLADLPTRCR